AIEAGGKDWSAPASLPEYGYTQPGRRLIVWPTKIEYFRQQKEETPFIAAGTFKWALLPGGDVPHTSPERFYYNYRVKGVEAAGYQFTAPHGAPKNREGGFSVNFDIPKGGQDVAFSLMANWTVSVPIGNLLLFKFRPPG